jgi:hypothetical protein
MNSSDSSDSSAQLSGGMVGKRRFVQALAEQAAKRVARRVVQEMQKLTDCKLSGDDSGLANVWDEICVQAQFDQSEAWEVYEETGTTIVAGFVSDLSIHEKEALWLQTEAGWDWDYDTRDANAEVPVVEDQIVDYVWTEYVLVEAGRWTNSRIRAYLERAGSCD